MILQNEWINSKIRKVPKLKFPFLEVKRKDLGKSIISKSQALGVILFSEKREVLSS